MKGHNPRIFKNKWFVRFAKRESIEDTDLCEAISNVEMGSVDADTEVKCDEKTVSE